MGIKNIMCEPPQPQYNLDIQTYSLQEILDLFNIKNHPISIEEMKQAKKKVLMLHPDKSKLSSDFFLFYKKAFDIVLSFFNEQNKINVNVQNKIHTYDEHLTDVKPFNKKVSNAINQMEKKQFNQTFNELFEKNMADKPKKNKNAWFQNEELDSSYDIKETNITKNNMNMVFNGMKNNAQQQNVIKYKGVQNVYSTNQSITGNYHEDEEEGEGEEYVACDLFGKLKFDDIKKVHKDQTILPVKETDISEIPIYNTLEQYKQTRQNYEPLNEEKSQQWLQHQHTMEINKMMQKEFELKKKMVKYEEKKKSVMAYFLLIT